MEIVVDAIIYQKQSHGGISRLYNEILPRMCAMDDSLRIAMLTERKPRQPLPRHERIIHRAIPPVTSYLRPGRVWRPVIPAVRCFVYRLWIGRGKGQIWHSTYYTQPKPWDGWRVVTVVDMIHEHFAALFDQYGNDQFRENKRRCVLAADAVICISEATRSDLQYFYRLDSNAIHVVPLACSDAFRKLGRHDSDSGSLPRPFLLYVGSRGLYKNVDRLLYAYSVWAKREVIELVVVGGPWSAYERQRLAELGIHDRVRLLTSVNDEELCELYNQAVAFIYPSLYEGFGIPLLEAMACGCPVIASRIPSTVEVAGECPIYFEPSDVEGLLAAFDVALSEGRDSKRVQAGWVHVKRYSWDETARRTLEVYHALSNPE